MTFANNDNAPVGLKHDADKPRFDLIDAEAMEQLAKVLTFGAKKYAAHNWRKGIAYSRLIAAAERHINAIKRNEDNDPETGLPHAAHAMCCLMFLIWQQKHRVYMDDRWKRSPLTVRDVLERIIGNPKETQINESLTNAEYKRHLGAGTEIKLEDDSRLWTIERCLTPDGDVYSVFHNDLAQGKAVRRCVLSSEIKEVLS